MAKRFTDTDKWKKPNFRGLEAPYKLLWMYIMDDCDHAGFWIVDLEVASIRIGFNISEADALNNFSELIEVAQGGSVWFIREFVDFQYGKLNPKNRAHNSVINLLEKNKIKPLKSPSKGVKDKDKVKDKDEDNKFEEFWDSYHKITFLAKTDKEDAKSHWNTLTSSEMDFAINKIELYFNSVSEKKYLRKARTYLSKKTFNDEFEKIKPREEIFYDRTTGFGIEEKVWCRDSNGKVVRPNDVEIIEGKYYRKT